MSQSTTTTQPLTLIAIHGNGGGGFRFDRICEHIPPDVNFIAPTLPGFAEVPADPTLQTMADYAAHIDEIVQAAARPCVLLGTGIGGSMILEYLQHYADHVDGVILHAPVGTRLDTRRFPALMNLPGARAFGQWLFSSTLTRPLFKRLLFVDHTLIPSDYLNRFFDEYRRSTAFAQMFDLITAAWYDNLRPVDTPAALLWGVDERVLSADHIEDYQQLLPNSTVRVVEGWDHFPMIEQPQAYTHEVIQLAQQVVTA